MANSTRPQRQPLRLQKFDCSSAGFYFVTICTFERRCLFGGVVDGQMCLNDAGDCVTSIWKGLGATSAIALDKFVVMPNHLHGIICLSGVNTSTGAMNCAPTIDPTVGARFIAPSLGDVVRGFKARCSIAIRNEFRIEAPIWQRNYYEHVIRSEASLRAIREYIANNPAQWHLDAENPQRVR